MDTICGIQRKNFLQLIFFWLIGIAWYFLRKIEVIDDFLPIPAVIVILLGLVIISIVFLVYMIHLLFKGMADARKHDPDYSVVKFIFSELRVSEEFEDERTAAIGQRASLYSNNYTEAFISLLLFLVIISEKNSFSAESLVFSGLLAVTIKIGSYIYIWRKEYYR